MNKIISNNHAFFPHHNKISFGLTLRQPYFIAKISNTTFKTINKRSSNKFGSLSVISKGFLVAKFSKIVGTRAGLYRMLLAGCLIHVVATVSGSLFIDRKIMMSIDDFLGNSGVQEDQMFQLFGILKPGSIEIKRGTLQTKFVITDFKNEIEVFYKGLNKFEFKEGNNIILTCYVPDKNQKKSVYCVDYLVQHSMEVNDWEDASNVRRESIEM